jgi:hypothetical protein
VIEQVTILVYTCERCGLRKEAASVFEADKPNGFYIDLLKVTGEKYPHHAKTPESVFYCTKECLIDGLQYGISHIVQDTVPIGMDPSKIAPGMRGARRSR